MRPVKLAAARAALCLLLLLPCVSLAQTNFAVVTSDGAWTWYNDARALFHQGKLYFGYVRAADSKTALGVFDLASGLTTDLWVGGFTQLDDHDNPGLLVKQDGRLLAAYSRHISDQYFSYRTSHSTNPVTAAGWNAEQSIPNSGEGMTYANPFQLPAEAGRIYNFCRNQNFNPTIYTSTNGGTNWSGPQLFIQAGTGGSVRPYVKFSSNNTNRIDFLYTDGHPRDVANSLYHLYYQGGAFYKTDGMFVKNYSALPILHDSGERGSVIYQYNAAAQADPNQWIPTGRAWNWEIAGQTNGDPVCVFTVQRDNVTGPTNGADDRIYYYYGRWTGAAWQKRFIAHAGRPLYPAEDDYAGGICLDPQNPNVIYLSSNAQDPFNLSDTTNVPLRVNQRYELWRGVTGDGGLSFAWTQITTNSTVDNLRPYVPRRNGGEPCVLWFRGTYTSYTAYNCSIVGLFTTAVPTSGSASGTWSSDADGAWGNSANWLSGIVADGSGNTADFSMFNITADRTVTVESPRTIGTLRFGDLSGSQNWRLNSTGAGTLTLAAGAPQILVNQNLAKCELSLAGVGGFTKGGAGTLVLAAGNALSGTLNLDTGSTTANDGAVRLAHPGAIAGIASPILSRNNTGAAAASTLELDGSAGNILVSQQLRVSCRNHAIGVIRNVSGSNTLSGGVSYFEGGTQITFQSDSGVLALTGAIQFQPNTGTFTAGRTNNFSGAGDFYVSGAILAATNGAPINVIKSGGGTLILRGTNTFANPLFLNGGAVNFAALNNLGAGAILINGGTLQFAPGNAADISTRAVTFNNGGATLDTGANNVTFANAVGGGGPGRLTKTGSGELTLNGANVYTGGTTISNGALRVNGSLPAGPVVIAGGMLSGTGTISGPVTVSSAGAVSPGISPGTLNFNSSLTNAGTLFMDLNKSGFVLTNDAIKCLGTLVYGGTLHLATTGDALAAGDSFKLFTAATYAGAFAAIVPSTPGAGLAWVTTGLTNGVLSVAAISRPQFGSITLSGTNISISGLNGASNGFYVVLSSTNLALPLANWTRLSTNSFNSSGGFTFIISPLPTVTGEFFLLQVP